MKKFIISFLLALTSFLPMAKADEGMWLLMLIERLNYVDMQKQGLQLTAEEIYSVNHSSLKDAIIQFGGGCTGEIISPEGLVLTNHHCGYGAIQSHSTVEHDYLTNGFWAYSKNEELPNERLTATFLIRMEDVTQKVLAQLNDKMTEKERNAKITEISKTLTDEATKGTHYVAEVKSFFNGNEFYMFVYEVFLDVRLVGAPPSSIGKFGGDVDNWMWPRHTGDFSMFRVYSGPDGKPAPYSPNNIPLKPRHFLPISLEGVKKGDFAMILGYPGRTNRYQNSYGINLDLEQTWPTSIMIRRKKLDIMDEYMNAIPAVKIQYASKYAGISNYWKNFIGMSRGLKRLHVADRKKQLETEMQSWIEQFPSRKERFGQLFNDLTSAYEQIKKYNKSVYVYREAIWSGPEVIMFARQFEKLNELLKAPQKDQAEIDKQIKNLQARAKRLFKDYYMPLDRTLWAEMMSIAYKELPDDQRPAYLNIMYKKYKGDFKKFAQDVYTKTIFAYPEKIEAFLKNPDVKVLDKDPVYVATKAFMDAQKKLEENLAAPTEQLARAKRYYMEVMMKMLPDKKFYPDANSTMRLTYGKVLDYFPADAVHYNYFTTLDGVMQKEDPNNDEFIVPEKLKQLYYTKDYGPYGENGVMKTCFLTDNDITGGNSGSPVLNGKGHLIGLAFDGNWEAMSGDIAFEPQLQRTINVDIRYVLFIIDKYAGAKNLINEMQFVSPPREAKAVNPVEF